MLPSTPTISRRRFLAAASLALATTTLASEPALQPITRKSTALGSEISLLVLHHDPNLAAKAIDAAFADIQRVDQLMSLYRPNSQISTLNRTGSLDNPHPWLVEVLTKSADLSRRSDGAFDITVQPLWELYASAKKANKLPDESALRSARQKVNWQKIDITPTRISLKDPGMAITLNAIAQGYATDCALAVLRTHGIDRALVNAGEVGALGRRADGRPWTIGIQHPRNRDAFVALAALDNLCLATSGDYATTFSDDRVYNHIFDPATGASPRTLASVTIVAPSAADADALATTLFVTGLEKGLKLLEHTPGAQALFVDKEGRITATKDFPQAQEEGQ